MDFETVATAVAKKRERSLDRDLSLLSLDPGHTTGWAYFEGLKLIEAGEIDTSDMQKTLENVEHLLKRFQPQHLVYEQYMIYKWKAQQHSGSIVHTIHVIGCIETLCMQRFVEYTSQPAQVAKNFCKDKMLKEWGFWKTASRHARDAIRHACYYIIFGDANYKNRRTKTSTVG